MESQMKAKDIEETEKSVSKIVYVVLGLFSVPLIFYASQFYGGLSNEQAVWGEFGDFLGGVMNPIISMAILFIVAAAYLAQKKELSETVKALGASATEQARQNEISKLQARVDVAQALLRMHTESVSLGHDEIRRVASVRPSPNGGVHIITIKGDKKSSRDGQIKYIAALNAEIVENYEKAQELENELEKLRDSLSDIP
jgi:large-conductance mechanosensitive channel